MPPLAMLAVVAALFELTLARLVWHGLTETIDSSLLFEARRLARFPRNLAAVAGLVAVITALLGFLRLPGYASITRRLVVAAFSGIFVPSVVVATLLPAALVKRKLVIFGLMAANILVTLITLTATRYRPERLLRVSVVLACVTAASTLASIGLGQLMEVRGGLLGVIGALMSARAKSTESVLLTMRHAGELSWLGVLVSGALAAVWDRGKERIRSRVASGVVLTVAFTVGWVVLEQLIGHRFRFLLFGGFRLALFTDQLGLAYALPLALGSTGGLMALVRADAAMRQLGAGLLAWLASGFAPHTPIQLLYLVLAALLLSRAAQARDPQGAWRRHHPWARLMGQPPPSDTEERAAADG